MKHNEIRKKFLKFFENLDHKTCPSSSLIPQNDPTILFVNAGMNQFKEQFLSVSPPIHPQVTSIQKCLRAGGKHNDLENVGHTARHHTFFEMMGNFSFGSYFKKEALLYSWKFLTNTLGIDKKRLYVSVYEKDLESYRLWQKEIGLSSERIFKLSESDNFWRMGHCGPCGPNSEIYYDMNPEQKSGGINVVGGDGDKYMEIWNLVFMQFEDRIDNTQVELKQKGVDTGMGLERLACVMQGHTNNYHTDLFTPLFDCLETLTQKTYDPSKKVSKEQNQTNIAFRILADHARAGSFLISNGALPSKEGRGYVLRRILRRAIRYGHRLQPQASLLPQVALAVIEQMKIFYPELEQKKTLIHSVLQDEQERFSTTLEKGLSILEKEVRSLKKKNKSILNSSTAFKLYDTFGFPIDLTQAILREESLSLNENELEKELQQARLKSQKAQKNEVFGSDLDELTTQMKQFAAKHSVTEFVGYESLTLKKTKPLAIFQVNGQPTDELKSPQEGWLSFSKTPFYAEGGGQVGDQGLLSDGSNQAIVKNTKVFDGLHALHISVTKGGISINSTVDQIVSETFRKNVTANHSATHLLHYALKKSLGEHVNQAGSLVSGDKLRFDFTHTQALTSDELKSIETLVDAEIEAAHETLTQLMPYDEAIDSGAMALFDEKYSKQVRVLSIGPSKELCGGCHVKNTAQIRCFKILSESSVSSGIRRIEALTASKALNYLSENTRLSLQIKNSLRLTSNTSTGKETIDWVAALEELKKENRALKKSRISNTQSQLQPLSTSVKQSKSKTNIFFSYWSTSPKDLRPIVDEMKKKDPKSVFILISQQKEKLPVLVGVGDSLVKTVDAGALLKFLTQKLKGSGGGRKDFAQGALVASEEKAEPSHYQTILESIILNFMNGDIS